MIKIGLVGFGFMGRMHFDNYERIMSERDDVKLVAVCDIQIHQLKNSAAAGNMATEKDVYDLSNYNLYESIDDMIANEELDIVDLTLPTYLHADITCDLLAKGINVFCEKPIAGNSADAWKMVQAAKDANKKLMIGQCLRFWPAYELLKEYVDSKRFGEVTSGYFFRGSAHPKGWFLDGEKSGGNILDMHIHDTDMINWLFGKPLKVSSIGRNSYSTSGLDNVTTNYIYSDSKAINAQSDWTLFGDFGFQMVYRVNFEKGNIEMKADGTVVVNPNDEPGFVAELSSDAGYYREVVYFIDAVKNNTEIEVCTPESAAVTLEIIEAEMKSVASLGDTVTL